MPNDGVSETYGRVAARYADAFGDELARKPLDRALLAWFAEDAAARGLPVADLGTGSGHIAHALHAYGLQVTGIDLSPQMIAEARKRHPGVEFVAGDLLHLAAADGTYGGITAFYAIVHLDRDELVQAFREAHRALAPGGCLLVAWHVGEETLRPDKFLEEACTIAWRFFPMATVIDAIERAGMTAEVRVEREPYPEEHASTRGYVLARRQ